MFWLGNCFPPFNLVKTFLTRTLPLLLCIAVGAALSWLSIYAFYFAAVLFHSVPVMRACDAVGSFLLSPARWIFAALGGDQSTIFYDPVAFSGTNGLILGILFYCVFRAILNRRTNGKPVAVNGARRQEAPVG
jgi:xanthine/uracil/vitamin C permease (AzgA family)